MRCCNSENGPARISQIESPHHKAQGGWVIG